MLFKIDFEKAQQEAAIRERARETLQAEKTKTDAYARAEKLLQKLDEQQVMRVARIRQKQLEREAEKALKESKAAALAAERFAASKPPEPAVH